MAKYGRAALTRVNATRRVECERDLTTATHTIVLVHSLPLNLKHRAHYENALYISTYLLTYLLIHRHRQRRKAEKTDTIK